MVNVKVRENMVAYIGCWPDKRRLRQCCFNIKEKYTIRVDPAVCILLIS